MEIQAWLSICIGLGTMLVLGVAGASGAADNASGGLQIGGEHFALKYVFAVMEQDGVAADREKLTVFLSDLPVPDELRKASDGWVYWADQQARAGALHGATVAIDPASGVWKSGRLLTRQGIEFYSESVSSPELSDLRFTPAGPLGDQVAGKVSMNKNMPGAHDDAGWRLEAEFRSAVIRRPTVSGVLTGAEALNSAPSKAVLAFLDACRKKDIDAIRNAMDPQSRETLAQMIASNREEALNMFAQMAAETAALKVFKVTIRGDSAQVEFGDGKPGSEAKESLSVALVNGEWKLAQ